MSLGGEYFGGALPGGFTPSGGSAPVAINPTASSVASATAFLIPPYVRPTARSVSGATATMTSGVFLVLTYPTVLTPILATRTLGVPPYNTTLTIVI